MESDIRTGLGFLCVALIGFIAGTAAGSDSDIGGIALWLSGAAGILGLAYIAYALLAPESWKKKR